MVHGATSPRRIGARAAEILAAELAKPTCAPYLREPDSPFTAALTAWSEAEAVKEHLFSYLDEHDLAAALAEVTKEASEDEASKGKVRRRSVSRRTVSAFDAWLKASAHAAALRTKAGLDPVSAARLSRDLSQSRWYQSASPLDQALDRIEAERQAAIEAGGDGGG